MIFAPEKTGAFTALFGEVENKIRSVDGCLHLELLRDADKENIFFTYSYWQDAAKLENYRKSELFRSTWNSTKKLFLEPAEAWTLHTVSEDPRQPSQKL